MNRLIEGYDVPGDSLYIAWKILHNDWIHINEQIQTSGFDEPSSLSEDIERVVNSVLKYPIVERNSRKKTDLPKHMMSKNALKILKLQEEEKRRVEIVKEAKRQKKITKSLQTKNKTVSKENVSELFIPSRRST